MTVPRLLIAVTATRRLIAGNYVETDPFADVALMDGEPTLRMASSLPPVGTYQVDLTETVAGYDNSPRTTTLTFTITGATPIEEDLSGHPTDLLALIPLAPPPGLTEVLIKAPLDPRSRRKLAAQFSIPLEGKKIAGIEAIEPDDALGALGGRIRDGDKRPGLDIDHDRVSFSIEFDEAFWANAAFAGGGIVGRVKIVLSVQGTQDEAIAYSVTFIVRFC